MVREKKIKLIKDNNPEFADLSDGWYNEILKARDSSRLWRAGCFAQNDNNHAFINSGIKKTALYQSGFNLYS